jgi:hypothetical protein
MRRFFYRFVAPVLLAGLVSGCGSTPTTQRDLSGEPLPMPTNKGGHGQTYELPTPQDNR